MPPQPMPKARGLSKRLARMATADAIDEFALRRIEADAQKLMRVDAAGGHLALAKVAALRWEVDEMIRRHELAITLRDSAFTRCDYSDSLTLVGEIDEAFEVAREASSRAPDESVRAAPSHQSGRSGCAVWRGTGVVRALEQVDAPGTCAVATRHRSGCGGCGRWRVHRGRCTRRASVGIGSPGRCAHPMQRLFNPAVHRRAGIVRLRIRLDRIASRGW